MSARPPHPVTAVLNVVANGGDHVAQDAQDLEVVVDDQDACHSYISTEMTH